MKGRRGRGETSKGEEEEFSRGGRARNSQTFGFLALNFILCSAAAADGFPPGSLTEQIHLGGICRIHPPPCSLCSVKSA